MAGLTEGDKVALTSTSEDLRKEAHEARAAVVALVETQPGIHIDTLYGELAAKWREPAVRTAIWDLIAERQLNVRRGNKLHAAA